MGKPFIKLIQSPNAYYFFDVNKNQIVRIPEASYRKLETMLQGEEPETDETIERLKRMGFLSDFHVKTVEHPQTGELEEILSSKMKTLVLQITQGCNFRCSYCIYSEDFNELQRSHSSKSMSMETAKAAVDFFEAHSGETALPSVLFYGGEPLLEFDKMKQIIAYAKEKLAGRRINFHFTTNGSLLTPETADYLYENEVLFMLSLDGLEKIHDAGRRYADGKGTYAQIRKNMEYIRERYPEYFRRLSMNTVVDQHNDYDEVISVYEDPLWGEMQGFWVSYIDDIYAEQKTEYTQQFREKEEYHIFQAYMEYIKTGQYTGRDALAKQDVQGLKMLRDTFDRRNSLPEKGAPSGPCVPGKSKLFVNVDGDFFPCERDSELSGCMNFGNVRDGIDYEAARRLMNIGKLTEESCRQCWAFNHCGLCVRQADGGGQLSGEIKAEYCEGARRGAEQKIRDYIMLKEYSR